MMPPVIYQPTWLAKVEADTLLGDLTTTIAWQSETIMMYGKPVAVPRQVAWYGDSHATYTYSGVKHQPLPWHPTLKILRERLEQQCQTHFNSVLCNYYRDGQNHMGWHSDDEKELGIDPIIASISLGAGRDFYMRHKQSGEIAKYFLEHGSLLVMLAGCQKQWQHSLPKRLRCQEPRINLTFRQIMAVN